MTGLVRLDAVWGGDVLIEAPPRVDRLRDALYLPWSPDRRWGLFDGDGLAAAAAWEHGPQGSAIAPAFTAYRLEQPLAAEPGLRREAERAREPLIYGGRVFAHFGHFLLETLPRLWAVDGRRRVLVHGPADLAACLELPWLRSLLGALGLRRKDFVWFDRPVVCRHLLVPQPAFRPQSHAHRRFGELCRRIGARLTGPAPARGGAPVYLTKSGLSSGVTGLVDEHLVEARLQRAGVEVVRPERLPLVEQIGLFATRPAVLGVAGSAFHLGAFAPPTARQVRLNPWTMVNSNHRLLDGLSGRPAVDLHQPGTTASTEPGGFQALWRLADPEAAAEGLLGWV